MDGELSSCRLKSIIVPKCPYYTICSNFIKRSPVSLFEKPNGELRHFLSRFGSVSQIVFLILYELDFDHEVLLIGRDSSSFDGGRDRLYDHGGKTRDRDQYRISKIETLDLFDRISRRRCGLRVFEYLDYVIQDAFHREESEEIKSDKDLKLTPERPAFESTFDTLRDDRHCFYFVRLLHFQYKTTGKPCVVSIFGLMILEVRSRIVDRHGLSFGRRSKSLLETSSPYENRSRGSSTVRRVPIVSTTFGTCLDCPL